MKFLKIFLFAGVGFFLLIFISYIYSSILIGRSVRNYCRQTELRYKKTECVDGFIAFLKDEKNPLLEKNHIVWAAGQLGDKKALPVLQKYYTGTECDHDKYLCQYELKKAIKLLESEFNATAWIWRNKIFE